MVCGYDEDAVSATRTRYGNVEGKSWKEVIVTKDGHGVKYDKIVRNGDIWQNKR